MMDVFPIESFGEDELSENHALFNGIPSQMVVTFDDALGEPRDASASGVTTRLYQALALHESPPQHSRAGLRQVATGLRPRDDSTEFRVLEISWNSHEAPPMTSSSISPSIKAVSRNFITVGPVAIGTDVRLRRSQSAIRKIYVVYKESGRSFEDEFCSTLKFSMLSLKTQTDSDEFRRQATVVSKLKTDIYALAGALTLTNLRDLQSSNEARRNMLNTNNDALVKLVADQRALIQKFQADNDAQIALSIEKTLAMQNTVAELQDRIGQLEM